MMRLRTLGLALLLVACAQPLEKGDPLPAARFHFPTGVALTPERPDLPQRLLVVSSNVDLRYRSGLVHAFDREALDALIDEAVAACEGEDCPIPHVMDLAPALVGGVEIGDLAGEIAAVALEREGLSPVRAFVPVRGTGSVVAVDLDAEGIRCARRDGRCIDGGATFPREDPFLVTTGLGMVFVGHATLFRRSTGAVGVAPADAPFWETGGGVLSAVTLGRTAIGGLAVGNCRTEGGRERCTLFASSRSAADAQRIFAFDFAQNAFPLTPIFSRNLAPAQDGMDSRGLAISPSRPRAYLAQRGPDALAIVDVSRMPDLPSDGCVVPEDVEIPDGEACPDLPGPTGEPPRFATVALSPAPLRPLVPAVIERTTPEGESRDLVVLATERELAFYDAETAALVGNVENVGRGVSGIAIAPRGEGVRLYLPLFGRSILTVVDVPDLFRPQTARVVARLGPPREED